MYVNIKLKLNKFVHVAIPKPRDYFKRFGSMLPSGNSFSGDNPAPMPERKIDTIANGMSIDAYQQYAEQRAAESANVAPDVNPE